MTADRPAHAAPWYQDAVIYQLHVRTFCDSNGDGIGDFPGLISKLDYLERLGVTCLWLLPFCTSPLRDDGYDVEDYREIHPAYGTLDDVRRFLDEAHRRGLRVITELVINHTSDQHPWFQEARRAPRGSPARDFYVWSDTGLEYGGARVIFHDTEASNWSWDPAAGAYFWHRFFHHQPDLNFDNPAVREAVLGVVRFWLDLGVDGLRLDAIAHLFEREGTDCDNLPETHAFLKALRLVVETEHGDRALLAEVNQSTARTREYFGNGDECHMAFHFPLMPRLFQALADERAEPIAEIVTRTLDIPARCQWALFLRNHDELTLAALPAEERERLMSVYAPDPAMRLHHGVRRRLASLLANDHDRILLATTLTLSLPGSPILYYGDEIGMGDDVSLPDRFGVRTPMQWNDQPHAGFASPDVVRPVLPVVHEGEFDYRRVNVLAQETDSRSLLARTRHAVAVRQARSVFGWGVTRWCDSGSPHVLAFTRGGGEASVLVMANLARSEVTVRVELPSGADGRSWAEKDLLDGRVLCQDGTAVQVTLPGSAIGWWPVRSGGVPGGSGTAPVGADSV